MSLEKVREFLDRVEPWIKSELPGCSYGIVRRPNSSNGKMRVALRPSKITSELQKKIDEFEKMVNQEGFELEVREVGEISLR